MSLVTNKVFRIAPSRNGSAIASAWKIWTQGNEFYATARLMGQVAKLSFHSSGYSQFRAASAVQKFPRGRPIASGTFRATSITFLVEAHARKPYTSIKGVYLVDTPLDHKMTIEIIHCLSSAVKFYFPAGVRSVRQFPLRDESYVIVSVGVAPFDERDRSKIRSVKENLRVNIKPGASLLDPYAEVVFIDTGIDGNVISMLVPGDEVFVHAKD